MAYRTLPLSGTAGTALTSANSGATFQNTASGSATYTTKSKGSGSTGATFISGSAGTAGSNTTDIRWTDGTASSTSYVFAGLLTMPASMVSGHFTSVMTPRHSAGVVCRLMHRDDFRLLLNDVAGTPVTTYLTTAGQLAANGQYFVTLSVQVNTTTTGAFVARVYDRTGTTLINSASASNLNFGTNPMVGADWGIVGGNAGADEVSWADIQEQDGTLTLLNPVGGTNNAPVANAGADQTNVEPASLVTVGGTDTDSDGTIASIAWTQTTGTTVTLSSTSTASPTFVAPITAAGTTITLRKTVTDNLGATGNDDVVITVLPAPRRVMVGGTMVPMAGKVYTAS